MPQGLTAKIGADDREFSEVLERSSRKWKSFGRDLSGSAQGLGTLFGSTTKELGKLGQGFAFASDAAGIFAGTSGLLGIGSSLAIGGPVLAGLALLSYAMTKMQKDAEESKKKLEDFKNALDVFAGSTAAAAGTTRVLQGRYNTIHAEIDRLEKRFAGSMTDPLSRWVIEHATNLGKLKDELTLVGNEMFAVGDAFGKVAPKEAADRTRKLADELERLRTIADKMNERGILEAWRLTQPNYIGGSVRGGVGYQSMIAGMRLDAISAVQPHGNLRNPLGFQDLKPELFEAVREFVDGQKKETDAIMAGFDELPGALAGVLGPFLATALGNAPSTQIGGTIGGAFGTGIGGYLAKTAKAGVGAFIGSAFAPILGTAIGGLIGSIFGGSRHEQAVDNNTAALNRVAEQLSNLPTGLKVAQYRYNAADPSYGNQGPFEGGAGPRPPRSGGITIHNVIVQGVTDLPSLIRKIGTAVQSGNARGGSTSLRVAMNPAR